MAWLDGLVDLPAGYKTTRRDVLKLLPLAGMLASFGVVLTRAKVSLSFLEHPTHVCETDAFPIVCWLVKLALQYRDNQPACWLERRAQQ